MKSGYAAGPGQILIPGAGFNRRRDGQTIDRCGQFL